MDWQPIETAPKDGTRILLWPVKVHRKEKLTYEEIAVIGYWYEWPNDAGGAWCGATRSKSIPLNLTHWMPLPAAPQ